MEIESQRLDFLTHYTYHKSPEHFRAKKKKKKTRRTQVVACDLGRARCPGRVQPGSRATPALRAAWAAHDLSLEVLRATIRSRGFAFFLLLFFYLAFCLAAQKIIKFGSLCFSLRSDGCVLDFFSFFSCVFWLV